MNKFALAAVFAVFAGTATAQGQPSAEKLRQAQEAYKKAQEAMKTKDFDTVITACEKVLSISPETFLCNYWLGFAYQSKRQWSKSAQNFSRFLEEIGKKPEAANNPQVQEMVNAAHRQAGLALARTRDTAGAVPHLEKALAAKPNDKEVHYFMGVVLLKGGQEDKAQEHFEKVIQLDPKIGDPYYYSGRIAFNKENWDLAQQRLQKFLELKPTSSFAADAHFMLGSMAIRQAEGMEDPTAKHEEAIAHLQKFLEMKPNSPQAPQAHYILGSLAAQREDTETARMHFEKYLELQPEGPQAEEVKKFLADLKQGEAGGA